MHSEPVEKIFAIRHIASGNFQEFNRKSCWVSKSAAKSSYRASSGFWDGKSYKYKTFDDQIEYEIVELLEPFFQYEDLRNS